MEKVNASDTIEVNLNKAVKHAKEQINHDEQALRLIQRIKAKEIDDLEKIMLTREDQRRLDKLVELGMVNVYLDNTVDVSRIGKKVLRSLK